MLIDPRAAARDRADRGRLAPSLSATRLAPSTRLQEARVPISDLDDPIPPTTQVVAKPMPAPAPISKDTTPGRSQFPLILAALFAAAIAGSWFAQGGTTASGPSAPIPTPSTPPVAEAEKPAEAKPAPSAAPTVLSSLAASKDALDAVTGDLKALTEKVDALPKPEAAADVKAIQDKVDALAKSVEGAADAPKKVDELAAKLAESEKAAAALKVELDMLKAEVAAVKEARATPAPSAEAKPDAPKPGVDAAAMTAAVDLFKASKFADALNAFAKLPDDDARVLYFTALARGFSTNTWTGETEATVLKGVAREKAGSPAKAEIDAAFGSLTKAQGKDWLDAFRARAK